MKSHDEKLGRIMKFLSLIDIHVPAYSGYLVKNIGLRTGCMADGYANH